MGENRREKWIDQARAIAVILVVMGHFYQGNNIFYIITSPIKMPVFYFLSGYTFNSSRHFKDFLITNLKRLFIPYFLFSLLPFRAVRSLIQGQYIDAKNYCVDFLTGESFWYIPSFFISLLIVYFIYKILRYSDCLYLIVGVVFFVLGLVTKNVPIFGIWCVNTAFTGVLFMIFGIVFRNHIDFFILRRKVILFISIPMYCILVFLSYMFYPNERYDMHSIEYYNIAICFGLIVCGVVSCVLVLKKCQESVILYPLYIAGQHTLFIYLSHFVIVSFLCRILNRFISYQREVFFSVFIYTILTCSVATVISFVISKICPVLMGKKRR